MLIYSSIKVIRQLSITYQNIIIYNTTPDNIKSYFNKHSIEFNDEYLNIDKYIQRIKNIFLSTQYSII